MQFLAGDDLRPLARGVDLRLDHLAIGSVATGAEAGEQSHAFVEGHAFRVGELRVFPVAEHLVEPVAIDFDPLAFEIHEA